MRPGRVFGSTVALEQRLPGPTRLQSGARGWVPAGTRPERRGFRGTRVTAPVIHRLELCLLPAYGARDRVPMGDLFP